jgi:hypothetical protein
MALTLNVMLRAGIGAKTQAIKLPTGDDTIHESAACRLPSAIDMGRLR